ncbi:hypothetical protein BJY04DRAFT_224637 [Aspergillus karnatakaensis]|uniref:Zn(II)2Cys6 transcription factor n=1 Tax=Aspergillus karnatakaensis TaxID=1810916 RepID=UPI003CCE2888
MVYCGRPSKGCHECRSRKILCDQQRPTCSQCQNANRVCPGYRDTLSLMFRDESEQVIQKATSARRKSKTSRRGQAGRQSKSKASSRDSPSPTQASEQSPTTSLESSVFDFDDVLQKQIILRQPQSLQPSYQPTQDEAISWFLRNNAWPGALFMIDFDPQILAQGSMSPSENARMASLVSVGTAMLARVRQSEELREAATKEYGRALTLLTRAVSIEEESRANATLSAVLLLALFEVITSRTLGTINKWTSHVYGASALLELRGQEELQNSEGLNLFIQLRFQIILSCLQLGLHVPDSLLNCNKIAMYLRPQIEAYCDRIIYITGQLSNLRADIHKNILTDPYTILSKAYAIEADLIAWLAISPPEFLYTTIEHQLPAWTSSSSTTPPPLYNNRYHLYHDLWVGHTWNQYRCSRIIVSEIILACLRRLSSLSGTPPSKELRRQCTTLRKTTRDLALDICASVPYHFGFPVDTPSTPSTTLTTTRKTNTSLPPTQTNIGGMLLLLPLAIAAATEQRGHPMRRWVTTCLNVIGRGMGIDQAFAILEMLDVEAGFFEDLEETEGGVVFLETDKGCGNRILVSARSALLRGDREGIGERMRVLGSSGDGDGGIGLGFAI